MTHVNFLFHRLLVSETQTDRQTDRQDKFVIDIYIYIYTRIPVATLPDSSPPLRCGVGRRTARMSEAANIHDVT